MRILFCNIAWMKYYKGTYKDDIPMHGGSYVDEHNDANESTNFIPILVDDAEDVESKEYCFGSFETKCTNGARVNQLHIEKINGCGLCSKEAYVDDVLVVWCARSYKNESVVVGWYKNATVFRDYQILELCDEDNNYFEKAYNICAKASDCVLLPERERNRHIWAAARAQKKGRNFGFGRANVWYASEESAKDYVAKLVSHIENYDGENWVRKIPIY